MKVTDTHSRSLFGIVEDHAEKYTSLETLLKINRTSTFYFQFEGNAMSPYIRHGDLVIIDRSQALAEGKIILFSYEGQFLCRRLEKRSGQLWLCAFNPHYRPLFLHNEAFEGDMVFFGVAIGMARRFV